MTLFINYLEEERNECQDRLNQLNGTHACTSERMRKARKAEKVYILSDKVRELLKK
jgi:predicted nuclease with TOPRIM domain